MGNGLELQGRTLRPRDVGRMLDAIPEQASRGPYTEQELRLRDVIRRSPRGVSVHPAGDIASPQEDYYVYVSKDKEAERGSVVMVLARGQTGTQIQLYLKSAQTQVPELGSFASNQVSRWAFAQGSLVNLDHLDVPPPHDSTFGRVIDAATAAIVRGVQRQHEAVQEQRRKNARRVGVGALALGLVAATSYATYRTAVLPGIVARGAREAFDSEGHQLPGAGMTPDTAKIEVIPMSAFEGIPDATSDDTFEHPRVVDPKDHTSDRYLCTSTGLAFGEGTDVWVAVNEGSPLAGGSFYATPDGYVCVERTKAVEAGEYPDFAVQVD